MEESGFIPAASAAYLNQAVERTGHTTGFFPRQGLVGCGPPLTAGVRLLSQQERHTMETARMCRVYLPPHIRGFHVLLTFAMLTAAISSEAQPRPTLPRVGVLEPRTLQIAADSRTCLHGFQQGLHDLGYVEGQNVVIEYRYAEGHPQRLPALAAELVHLAPDVIWTHSTDAIQAVQHATTTIPIVVGVGINMVEEGLVAGLAQPGGNLTGLELRDIELMGRRLQLLKEAMPTLTRVAVLVNPTLAGHERVPGNIAAEARTLGVQLQRVEAGSPDTFEAAFAAMVHGRADALLSVNTAFVSAHRQQLLALALRYRLPTMSYGRHFAEAGSLLALGADSRELCQRSTVFVHKILHGATPADLPIERVDKFPLVINLQTAEVLGLTLAPMVLFQANEVLK